MNAFPTLRSSIQNACADPIVIRKSDFTIGRSLSCDLVVESIAISRIQCVINERNGCWQLSDVSTNGTLVNNTLHQKGTSRGYVKLKDGDTISFPTSDQKIEYIFNTPKELSYETTEGLPEISKQPADIDKPVVFVETSDCNDQQRENTVQTNISEPCQQSKGNKNENKAVMPVIVAHPSISSKISQLPKPENNLVKVYLLKFKPGPSQVVTNSVIPIENKIETNIPGTSQNSDEITNEEHQATENLPETPFQSEVEIVVQTSENTENTDAKHIENNTVESPSDVKPEINKNGDIDVMESELTCSICSELFIKAMTLSCSHTFCQFCIHQWKKSKNTCPICRKNIDTISPTLVLDNFITRRLELCSESVQKLREEIKQEREQSASASVASTSKDPQPSSSRHEVLDDSIEELEEEEEEEDDYSFNDSNDVYFISDDEGEDDWDDSDEDDDAPSKPYFGGYGRCFICQDKGHWANACPLKPKRPRRY